MLCNNSVTASVFFIGSHQWVKTAEQTHGMQYRYDGNGIATTQRTPAARRKTEKENHMTERELQSPFIVHQEYPFNAEPPGDLLRQSLLTPQERFFVRTHGTIPTVDPTSYRLRITGLVEHEREFSLDELKALSSAHTVTATLQCAGNRRNELVEIKPMPGKVPFGAAISTATWGGIPLREVLQAVGVKKEAQYVAFRSLDEIHETEETISYGASIALEKALSPDVLLAYEMNDEPLTPEHGFPVRVVVPGYIGARSVKWIGEIRLQDQPSDNYYQARDYKLFPPEITEETADWDTGQTIENLILNTVITTPQAGQTLPAGPMRIQGYAIADEKTPVERVELSADGGKTWVTATIVERADPYAWCFWEATLTLPAGNCQLIARSWDTAHRTQPEKKESIWSFRGYMNNAWHHIHLHLL
jgi:sulfite oxidase